MAKKSAIERNLKRIKLAKKYANKRAKLKKKLLIIKKSSWLKDLLLN